MATTVSPEFIIRLLNPVVVIPSPPTGVLATDSTSTANCTVTWDASGGATSYEVWRSAVSGQAGTLLASGITLLTYADTTGVAGTVYYYGVKAVNAGGTSALSTQDSGSRQISSGGSALAKPFGVTATQNLTANTVMISWCSVVDATSYKVYRSTTSGSLGSLLGTTGNKTFRDGTTTAGVNYYYSVIANNLAGDSPTSNQSLGKCSTATLGTNQVQVSLDSSGKIPDSWWTALPLFTMVEVVNSNSQILYPGPTASGYLQAGSSDANMAGAIDAYSGAAFDQTTGRFWCAGGGHTDSRNNGMYEFDASSFVWRVAVSPSIVTSSLQSLAQQLWNATPYAWIEYDQCTDGVSATRYWPDGKAGAQHTYHDMTYVPDTNEVVRASRFWWHFNVETGQEFRGPAMSFYSNCRAIYDDVGKKHYRYGGDGRNLDESYDIYDPINRSYVGRQSIGLSPTTSYVWGHSLAIFDIPGNKLFYYNQVKQVAWVMDKGTRSVTSVPLTTPIPNTGSQIAYGYPFAYVDDLNVMLLLREVENPQYTRTETGFNALNLNNNTGETPWGHAVSGNWAVDSYTGIYGRMRYYKAKKTLVIIPQAWGNIRLMRMA